MSEDYKARVQRAIMKHAERELKKNEPKRKHNKPEKLVEKDCLDWMRSKGWDINIYESKATYSPSAGRYMAQSMKAGTCDCIGISNEGEPVFVEFKAKGKCSTFAKEKNMRQQDFLIAKINLGAFACVVDSANLLEAYYIQWKRRKEESFDAAKAFLLDVLPRSKKQNPIDF